LNLIEKLIKELNAPSTANALPEPIRELAVDAADSLLDVQDGFERISLLVARLKGFARESSDETARTDVDLTGAVTRAIAVAGVGHPAEAIRLGAELDEPVSADERAVVQILVNLILNAIQASNGSPEVEIDVLAAGDDVEVRVSDRGPGFDLEAIDRIFDPFFTTKSEGTGLGLSISHDLARRLGARLEAGNREGGGAVFRLFLPRAA
jgi:C4-dicarboxylate-specific signal transduction histidine kinase